MEKKETDIVTWVTYVHNNYKVANLKYFLNKKFSLLFQLHVLWCLTIGLTVTPGLLLNHQCISCAFSQG